MNRAAERQVVLGIGAGQCGFGLLRQILERQPAAKFTCDEKPYLPWEPRQQGPSIRERLKRWKSSGDLRLIGDLAHFYLPYIDEAVACEPTVRVVCLQRSLDEFVAATCHELNARFALPVSHWCRQPGSGWHHDPLRSFTYPQYDETDRRRALTRFWREYYAQAEELANRHPENVLVLDAAALTQEAGVRRILDFIGLPADQQVVLTGKAPPSVPPIEGEDLPVSAYPDPDDPRRCTVLVPFVGGIHQECETALSALESRGYRVLRVSGYAAIDQARNQLATDALVNGCEETLWIDSDIAFNPDDVEKLRRHDKPVVCGIYPQKAKRSFACEFLPGTQKVSFGTDGGLHEILYAGTGFLLIRREVYSVIQQQLALPVCNDRFNRPTVPFFEPMIRVIEDGHWYLAEDFSFCERARQCGFDIHADTTIRLWHIGNYPYGWEDAGLERALHEGFTLQAVDPHAR